MKCLLPSLQRRHLLQQTVVYAAASDTATVLVDEGGTAAPTPVTAVRIDQLVAEVSDTSAVNSEAGLVTPTAATCKCRL